MKKFFFPQSSPWNTTPIPMTQSWAFVGLLLTASLLATAFMFSGCGLIANRNASTVIAPHERDIRQLTQSGLIVKRYDLNGDGVPDVWEIYSEENKKLKLLRKESDLDFDGQIDMVQYFDDRGRIVKDEMDTDFDSRMDIRTYYENGKITSREINTEFDDAPDLIKYYEDNALIRIERDTDNDARIDVWEIYEDGAFKQIGKDLNNDGQPDDWQRM